MAVDEATDRKRGVGITLGGVAALLGIWYALPGQPVQATVCERLPSSWNVSPRVCASEFREIDAGEAEEFIDVFLARAAGAQPGRAYNMMSDSLRVKSKDFVRAWEPMLFADRVEPLRVLSHGHNRFEVTYKTYNGEGAHVAPPNGRANTYEAEIGLIKTGDDLELNVFKPPNRLDGERVSYYQEIPGDWAKTYDHPQRILDDVAAPRVGPQQRLSLLCQVEGTDGSWWSRTGWGWIAHADLVKGEGERAGVPKCSDHQVR